MVSVNLQNLHNSLVQSAKRFHLAEADLVGHIQRADKTRLYLHRGFDSMFVYVTKEIGLSDAVASNFICVARKAIEIPELKQELEKGNIGVSKLRKICPVITKQNKHSWITKAKTMPKQKLESAVYKENPQAKPRESRRQLDENTARLGINVNTEFEETLKYVQDLESSRLGRSVSREEALLICMKGHVERNCPMKKAERAEIRKANKEADQKENNSSVQATLSVPGHVKRSYGNIKRRKIFTAAEKHGVILKTGGRCTFVGENGQRCGCTRHLHIHHIKPVFEGGGNELLNLTLLCARHHKLVHERDEFSAYRTGL